MKDLEIELSIVNSDETIEKLTQVRNLLLEINSTLESIKAHQIKTDIKYDKINNKQDLETIVENLNSKLLHSIEMEIARDLKNDENLKKLLQPAIDYLKEKHHPYVEVVITQDGVQIKETIRSVPLKKFNPCCSKGKLNGSKCSHEDYLNMSLK